MNKNKNKQCIIDTMIYLTLNWRKPTTKRRKVVLKLKVILVLVIIIGLSWLIGSTAESLYGDIGFSNGVTYRAKRHLPVNEDKPIVNVEDEIRELAKDFKWPDYLIRLAKCESGLNPLAINDNGGHSNDRGVFQINDRYHPEVSDECAYDITCSTKWTMWRIESGHQNEWMCDAKI